MCAVVSTCLTLMRARSIISKLVHCAGAAYDCLFPLARDFTSGMSIAKKHVHGGQHCMCSCGTYEI